MTAKIIPVKNQRKLLLKSAVADRLTGKERNMHKRAMGTARRYGSAACPTDVAFGFEDVTPDSVEVGSVVVGQGDCVSVAYVGRLADGGGVADQRCDFRVR